MRLGGFVLFSIQEHGNSQSIKQKGTYRIICLGDSTTQRQYPQLLEQVLNQRNIGVHFSVVDRGRTGANTSSILSQIEYYLAEYHPDMVVTMMGINEKGVKYYQDIPEADTWLFRHCRVYRFGRIICGHILKKIKQEGLYGLNKLDPGRKAKLEDTGTVVEKINLSRKESIEKVAKLDSKGDKGSPGLRSSYLNRSKLPEVEESLRKVIELNPKNDNAYVELGRFYREQGESSELNPKNDNTYVKLERYPERDQFSKAEDLFKKATKLNPKNDKAYFELGRLYRDHGQFPQAEDLFKKAIELNPKNDKAYFELGWFYRNRGKFPQAEDSFKKVIELNPKNDYAYFELGWFYRDHGKFLQAEDLFKKAIEINLENDNAYRAILVLYEEIGKPDLAKKYAKEVNRQRLEYSAQDTVNNYRKLKEILDKKGIKLVCVQYPMRNVEPLKKIFEKDDGVIFVNNESVFKKALKKASSKEYFMDMFGGDFGHCTQKGNRLLAQNIADVILREVFNR